MVILVEDEASLYLQATTMATWAPRGQTPVIRAHPGREKANFYGTLNPRTGDEIAMRAEVMNAEVTAQHLNQVLATVPDVPILYLWDRAPWHRGEAIREVVEANPRLEIMFFPVAAPELNPQEQVSKAARRVVSHNHVTQRLPDLADQFESYLVSNRSESSFLDKYGLEKIHSMFN